MDTAALVENQINDGQKLVSRLSRGGFDVTAAFWVKPSEKENWFLYIASKRADEAGFAAYRTVYAALREMNTPFLPDSAVRLIGTRDPITVAVLDILSLHPGRSPARTHQPMLGTIPIDEVYIYPPFMEPAPRPNGRTVEQRKLKRAVQQVLRPEDVLKPFAPEEKEIVE